MDTLWGRARNTQSTRPFKDAGSIGSQVMFTIFSQGWKNIHQFFTGIGTGGDRCHLCVGVP